MQLQVESFGKQQSANHKLERVGSRQTLGSPSAFRNSQESPKKAELSHERIGKNNNRLGVHSRKSSKSNAWQKGKEPYGL